MARPASIRDTITKALKDFGPMTKEEIAEHTGISLVQVATSIDCARNLLPKKIFRIVKWYEQPGVWGRYLAIYAAGPGPDAKRKVLTKAERKAKNDALYRERNRAAINAKHRARRAKELGREAVANPWAQLVPPASRASLFQQRT